MCKYKLEKKVPKNDYFEVIIVADSNDADYITRTEIYTPEEFNRYVINELIILLQECRGRHGLEQYEGDFEWLNIPYNGWDGWCHSLESVTVTYYDTDGNVYNVNINEKHKLDSDSE